MGMRSQRSAEKPEGNPQSQVALIGVKSAAEKERTRKIKNKLRRERGGGGALTDCGW